MAIFDTRRNVDLSLLLVTMGRCVLSPFLLATLLVAGFVAGAPPFALARLHAIQLLAVFSALLLFWSTLPERSFSRLKTGPPPSPFSSWFLPAAMIVICILLVNVGHGLALDLAYYWTVLLLDTLLVAYAFRNLVRRRPRLAVGIIPVAIGAALIAARHMGLEMLYANHLAVLLSLAVMGGLLVLLSIGPMGPVRWGVTVPLFLIALLFLWGEGPPVRRSPPVSPSLFADEMQRTFAAHALWGLGAGQAGPYLEHLRPDTNLFSLDYLPDASMVAWVRQSGVDDALLFQKPIRFPRSATADIPLARIVALELGIVGGLALLALFLATAATAIYAVLTREATGETLLLSGLVGLLVALLYSTTLLQGPILPFHFFLAAAWMGLVAGLASRTLGSAPTREMDRSLSRHAILSFAAAGILAALFVFFTALPLMALSRVQSSQDLAPEEYQARLRQAGRLHPFHEPIAFQKARLQMSMPEADTREVNRAWREAVLCNPYNVRAYVEWARFHVLADDYDSADEVIALGRRYLPQSLLLVLWEAEIGRLQNDLEQEEHARRRAMQLAKGSAAVLQPYLILQIESTYLRANARTQALLASCQSFQLDPTDPFAAQRIQQLAE